MAGGLLWLNPTRVDLAFLQQDVGAKLIGTVFHSDKSWERYSDVLEERLRNPLAAQNRSNLPAHCYLTFHKNSSDKLREKVNGSSLARILGTVQRPTSIVKNQPALANWSATPAAGRAALILKALESVADVTLEFYTVGPFGVNSTYRYLQQAPE